jgi:hypothetical protein
MNAHSNITALRDYSQAQTHAEWVRDTKLRDIRQRYADLYQRLSARMAMEQGRVMREFDGGRYDR